MICPQYVPSVEEQEERIRRNILCARICTCISGRQQIRYVNLVNSLSSISGGNTEVYRLLLKNIYMQLSHFNMVLPGIDDIPAIGYTKEMTMHTILFDTENQIG